jgi:hypothetical protein
MMILLAYHGGPCFGMGGFLEGHGDILRGNRCLVGLHDNYDDDDETSDCKDDNDSSCYTSKRMTEAMAMATKTTSLFRASSSSGTTITDDEPPFVGRLWGGCEDSHVTLVSNEYYTPDGIALICCNGKDFYNLSDITTKFGLEVNSTNGPLPDVDTILEWATSIVMEKEQQQPTSAQQKSSGDVVSVLTTE